MTVNARTRGLREAKFRRTQQTIVWACAELTIEDGFEAATIERIAGRSEVDPHTISLWFPVTGDILFAELHDRIEQLELQLGSADGGDIVDRLWAWVLAIGRAQGGFDEELERLRQRAIASDPGLRARQAQLTAPVHDLLARTVAHDVGADAQTVGPLVFAAAAMSFLDALRDNFAAGQPDRFEQAFAGMEMLRATYAALPRSH